MCSDIYKFCPSSFFFPPFCSCSLFVGLIFLTTSVSYLLLYSISFIVSFSFSFLLFIGYVDTRLLRHSVAVSLCSEGGGRGVRVVWNDDVRCSRFPIYAKHNIIIILINGNIYKIVCIFHRNMINKNKCRIWIFRVFV